MTIVTALGNFIMKKLKFIFTLAFLLILNIGIAQEAPSRFMVKQRSDAYIEYAKERENLKLDEIHDLLDRGLKLESQTTLTRTLSEGGSAFFPHTHILSCGDQVAAVAHAALAACKKTGKNQILVIGVLHSLTPTLRAALYREVDNADLSHEPCRGIFGPGLRYEDIFREEFSLDNFIFLLNHAIKRANIQPPKIIVRYANLSQGHPETLPGIEEIKEIAKNSIVVATADLFHHGVCYNTTPEKALPMSQQAIDYAKERIDIGLKLLSKQTYLEYRDYALKNFSDSKEVGQLLMYLLGPLDAQFLEMRLVDTSHMFEGSPEPNWIAASLIELMPLTLK